MDKDLTKKLVDLAFGVGCYENPRTLLLNPTEEDEKKWRRRDASTVLATKQFTPKELDAVLNYCAEQRAQWRVSNERAKLSADIRAENAAKAREAEQKLLVILVTQMGAKAALDAGIGRVKIINAFQAQKAKMPEGL